MKTIASALLLSTALVGVASAGELGYRADPAAQSVATRAQVQNDLNAVRTQVRAFNGELDPSIASVRTGTASRTQVIQERDAAQAHAARDIGLING